MHPAPPSELFAAEYGELLETIQHFYPEAIIAGGALRDLVFGKPVKDVDVFIAHVPSEAFLDEITGADADDILSGVLWQPNLVEAAASYAGLDRFGIASLHTAYVGRHTVNIITYSGDLTPETLVNRVDFGPCQIAWDGARVILGDQFLADAAAKTWTYQGERAEGDIERSKRRAERFAERYPDWTFVWPAPVNPSPEGTP
jgi:hypothetical protein